jgi:hypothetical protein
MDLWLIEMDARFFLGGPLFVVPNKAYILIYTMVDTIPLQNYADIGGRMEHNLFMEM